MQVEAVVVKKRREEKKRKARKVADGQYIYSLPWMWMGWGEER